MANAVFAHEEAVEITPAPVRFLDRVQDLSVLGLEVTALTVGVLLLFSLLWRNKTEFGKWVLYLGIAIPVFFATLFLAGGTVYLNLVSVTGGPVHWHADYQFWACGQQLDLIDPKGLFNRVGSPVFHEHGDNRLHVEGVVVELKDVALTNFFELVGGEFHNTHLNFPTNERVLEFENGDTCADGTVGTLQTFVWKTDQEAKEFYQEKLSDPENYVISPYSSVPPGDCLIFEFGQEKEKTEYLCNFYQVAEQKGELKRR